MMQSDSVWQRRSANESEIISAPLYNVMIGLTLMWGFAMNYAIVDAVPVETVLSIGPIGLIIGYIVSCFFGIYLYTSSDKPLVSFIGYNFVVVPIGIILVPFLYQFDSNLIQRAMAATGAVTAGMMFCSSLAPNFFLSIGRTLFLSLILAIVVELIGVFVFKAPMHWMDYVMVVIFSGYIGYDWARANMIPKTLDNAIDSAASLYIDIINLFIRILQILSRR